MRARVPRIVLRTAGFRAIADVQYLDSDTGLLLLGARGFENQENKKISGKLSHLNRCKIYNNSSHFARKFVTHDSAAILRDQ